MKRLLNMALVAFLVLGGMHLLGHGIARAHNPITFNIADDVSAEDESYVTEGIRLAQDYLYQDLGVEADHRTIVNVRAAAAPATVGELGESAMDYIAIFTGSRFWRESPPFLRVEVTVHEFIHVYETDHLGEGHFDLAPAWIIEGVSEYLAVDAVATRGLVGRSFADDDRYWTLSQSRTLGPLKQYESLTAFQQEDASVYALSYLGIKELLAGRNRSDIIDFFDGVAQGNPWEAAFDTAFGQSVEAFYSRFESARVDFRVPAEKPAAYAQVPGQELPAPMHLTRIPGPTEAGNQMILLAKSEPTARCIFYLTGDALELVYETTVDAVGNLFWLATIPPGTPPQMAELSADCGGGEELAEIAITA